MKEIKDTLAYWKENKEEFDVKLVAREETGCCVSLPTEGGTSGSDGPCNE